MNTLIIIAFLMLVVVSVLFIGWLVIASLIEKWQDRKVADIFLICIAISICFVMYGLME